MLLLLSRYNDGSLGFGNRSIRFADCGFNDNDLKFGDLENALTKDSELSLFFKSIIENKNGLCIKIMYPVDIDYQRVIEKSMFGYDYNVTSSKLCNLKLELIDDELVFAFGIVLNSK